MGVAACRLRPRQKRPAQAHYTEGYILETVLFLILLAAIAVFAVTTYPWLLLVAAFLTGFALRRWGARILFWTVLLSIVVGIGYQWGKIPEFKLKAAIAYYEATMTVRAFLPDDSIGLRSQVVDANGTRSWHGWTYGQIRRTDSYFSQKRQAYLAPVEFFEMSFDELVASSKKGAIWGLAVWAILFVATLTVVLMAPRFRYWLFHELPAREKHRAKERPKDWRARSILTRVIVKFVKYPAIIVVGLMLADLLNTAITDYADLQARPVHHLVVFLLFTGIGLLVFAVIPLCLSLAHLYRREWRRAWEACFAGMGVASPWELNTLSGGWLEQKSPYRIAGVIWRKGDERLHTVVTGGAEVGRTAAIESVLAQMRNIRTRRDRAIVDDRKGYYLSQFYRQGRDIILNPAHDAGSDWDFFGDATAPADFDRIAEILIPELMNNKDQRIVEESRMLFSALAKAMWRPDGPGTDLAEFMRNLLDADPGDLSRILSEAGIKAPVALDDKITLPTLRAALRVHVRYIPLPSPETSPGGSSSKSLSFRKWCGSRGRGGFVFLTGHRDKEPEKDMTARIIAGIEQYALEILGTAPPGTGRRAWLAIDDIDDHHAMRVAGLLDGLAVAGACIIIGRHHGAKNDQVGRTDAQWGIKEYGTHLSLPPNERQKAEWKQHCLGKTSGNTNLGHKDIECLPPFDGLLRMPVDNRYAPVVVEGRAGKTVAASLFGKGG